MRVPRPQKKKNMSIWPWWGLNPCPYIVLMSKNGQTSRIKLSTILLSLMGPLAPNKWHFKISIKTSLTSSQQICIGQNMCFYVFNCCLSVWYLNLCRRMNSILGVLISLLFQHGPLKVRFTLPYELYSCIDNEDYTRDNIIFCLNLVIGFTFYSVWHLNLITRFVLVLKLEKYKNLMIRNNRSEYHIQCFNNHIGGWTGHTTSFRFNQFDHRTNNN